MREGALAPPTSAAVALQPTGSAAGVNGVTVTQETGASGHTALQAAFEHRFSSLPCTVGCTGLETVSDALRVPLGVTSASPVRMLCRAEFLRIQAMLGLRFTLDAYAANDGSTAQCRQFCSPANSFLHRDVSRQTIWMQPPARHISDYLKHYLSCKRNAPELTSAVLLLPKWQSALWRTLLTGMRLVHTYPKGAAILSTSDSQDSGSSLTSLPWPLEVWYDAPAPKPLLKLKATEAPDVQHQARFRAQVSGVAAGVLIDTGATGNFVSAALLHKLNLPMLDGVHAVAELADGASAAILGRARITVRLAGLKTTAVCYVLDHLLPGVDVILGEEWLRTNRGMVDYSTGTVSCTIRNRKHVLHMPAFTGTHVMAYVTARLAEAAGCVSSLISYKALRRHERRGGATFLVGVRETPPAAASLHTAKPRTDAPAPGPQAEGLIPTDELKALLDEYKGVFEPLTSLPPERDGIPHTIELQPGAKPAFRRPFRLSLEERAEVERKVKELLDKGWIRPSSSPWSAPVLFAPKQDGSLRMCIDYRACNAATVPSRHGLPRIDEILDSFHGANIFTSLDLESGYHQLRVREEDIPKTAFSTHIGQYEWLVLPMGLANAPATFQRVMNQLLRPYIGKFVLVYLDDLIVWSRSPEEHKTHLRLVLDKLKSADLRLKLSKCRFNQAELNYLGFVVGRDGIKPDPKKVAAVQDWPAPRTVTDVRGFLGLANFFRRFMADHGTRVAPLLSLTRGDAPPSLEGHWTAEHQKAFDAVKQSLTDAETLAHPDPEKPFAVTCDASVNGTGAVLTQDERPVAYHSHKFTPAEHNWPTGEQELWAVIQALQTWRCYLEGAVGVTIRTDHHPLTYLKTQPQLSRKQARWLEFLSRFNYEWQYIPGKTNPADALSRSHVAVLTRAQRAKQSEDTTVQPDASPDLAPEDRRPATGEGGESQVEPVTAAQLHGWILQGYQEDQWFHKPANTASLQRNPAGFWLKGGKIVVPNSTPLKRAILRILHDAPSAGHPGVTRTLEKVQRYYWWPAVRRDVEDYIRTCTSCQVNKPDNQAPGGLLQPLPVPDRKWSSISLDLITGLPRTRSGHDAILVFVDRLTKMVHLAPTSKDCSAKQCAQLFMQHVFRLHGAPDNIVSDRDKRWLNSFWEHLCSEMAIQQRPSTSHHPQTDGQTERMNRLLEETLRHYVSESHRDWVLHLPCAEFAINDSVSASTGHTPFFLNYGEHPRNPLLGEPPKASNAAPDAVAYTEAIADAVRTAKQLLKAAQDRQKSHADTRRRDVQFAAGQQVLLNTKHLRAHMQGCTKLLPRWIGPYTITALVGKVAAQLELPSSLPVHDVFHYSLLKPFHADGRAQPPPPAPALLEKSGSLWSVSQILAHRDVRKGTGRLRREYLVDWEGQGPEQQTWEPTEALQSCQDLIDRYWVSQQKAQTDEHPDLPAPTRELRRSPRLRMQTAAAVCLVHLPSGRLRICCLPVPSERRDVAPLDGGQL